MLSSLMEEVDNMQEQMASVSSEMETKIQGNVRHQM